MSRITTRLSPFVFTLLAASLLAQDPASSAKLVEPTRPPPVTITISFAGGTMATFVAQVRSREPKANIVVATAAASAELPAIELRSAGIDQAMEAACTVAASEHQIRVKEFRGPGEPVYSIMAVPMNPAARIGAADLAGQTTHVVSLNRLTANSDRGLGFPVATILSAIEAATSTTAGAPILRFHKDSGLLIVRGTQEQINTTEAVLRNLEKDSEMRRREREGNGAGKESIEPPKEGQNR